MNTLNFNRHITSSTTLFSHVVINFSSILFLRQDAESTDRIISIAKQGYEMVGRGVVLVQVTADLVPSNRSGSGFGTTKHVDKLHPRVRLLLFFFAFFSCLQLRAEF